MKNKEGPGRSGGPGFQGRIFIAATVLLAPPGCSWLLLAFVAGPCLASGPKRNQERPRPLKGQGTRGPSTNFECPKVPPSSSLVFLCFCVRSAQALA